MKSILNFSVSRQSRVENAAEELKNHYIQRTLDTNNKFSADFYCLCSEFSFVDAISCFAELDCFGNVFYENINLMDEVSWKRFFKACAMYNTIMICRKKRKLLNINFVKWDMFNIYEFEEAEQKFFELLWKMALEYESKFSVVFPQAFIKYVLRKNITDAASIAFVENFCYNSYETIMKYFSRYISVSRRIKLAKQA